MPEIVSVQIRGTEDNIDGSTIIFRSPDPPFVQQGTQCIVVGIRIDVGERHPPKIIIQHKLNRRAAVPTSRPDLRALDTAVCGEIGHQLLGISAEFLIVVALQRDAVALGGRDDVVVEIIVVYSGDPPVRPAEIDRHPRDLGLQHGRET